MSGLSGRRRLGMVAVVVLAVGVAGAALGFGLWATVTGNSALFGRLTALAGIFSFVLAAVIAAMGMIAWAHRAQRTPLHSPGAAAISVPSFDSCGLGEVRGQVVVGDIPQEPPGFLARADLSAELDRAGRKGSVVHAVTGMRGVGKTQLAAAYARARLADGWRLVAWVNAEEPSSLLAGLVAVSEALGLADSGTSTGGDDAGLVVRHWLEVDGKRCLVVFDDAADPDVLRPFVPAVGAARVLITSNRLSVANLGASVAVDVFSPDEALAFLADRTGLADNTGAGAVAGALGYLPLALAQAAAVIAAQHLAYGTYLDRLRALPVEEYLTREEGQPYLHGVAEAVLLSLQAVRTGDRADVCTGVMEIVAVLSAAGVRRDLLHDAGQAGALASGEHGAEIAASVVDRALAQLAERSLLTFSLDDETVIAHRLVMRVVRDGLARRGRFATVCRAAASGLDDRVRALAGSQDRPAVRDIAEQVMALRDNTADSACEADDELAGMVLQLRLSAQHYLNELGDSAPQAIVIGEQLTTDFERMLGPDDPDTLAARNNLAISYKDAGRVGEAISLYEQTLAARERVLGFDHPDTLGSRNNLAVVYGNVGRIGKAISLHEQTLPALERVLGPDDPKTLTSRSNLAAAYKEAGRVGEAIPLFKQALGAKERLLGPDHPSTLTSRSNLAVAYTGAGRYSKAISLYEQTLDARERVLGPDHPDTLASRSDLAAAYNDAGRVAEAIPLHKETLAAFERLLGPDHPSTLLSRNNLAVAYDNAGRVAEAISLYEQTLAARERLLDPDHPSTLLSRNNLAVAYRNVGRVAEAISLYEQTLAAQERLLGSDHPDTLLSRNNLAVAYADTGRVAEAISLFEQTLAAQERLLGPDHPDTLASRNNLAAANREAGRVRKTRRRFSKLSRGAQ